MTRRNPIDRPWASRALGRLRTELDTLDELLAESRPLPEAGQKRLERYIRKLIKAVEGGDMPPAAAGDEVADINRALLEGTLGIAESGIVMPVPETRQARMDVPRRTGRGDVGTLLQLRQQGLSDEKAAEAIELIEGRKDPEEYESVQTWLRQCYNRPSQNELIMAALNEVLGGHGVEAIHAEGAHVDDFHGDIIATYVNMGDAYTATIVLDSEMGEFIPTSYGDWLEAWEREHPSEEEEGEEEEGEEAASAVGELDDFTRSYIETALWSTLDDGGNPLDESYDIDDIAPATLARMISDCKDFQEANEEDLRDSGLTDDHAGHDFWLTREGHGAGFWDEGLGEIGRRLTNAAHAYGSFDLYVGDDGKIHGS